MMKKTGRVRYFSLLTLVAFLMNVMLPFFAVYHVPQAVAAPSEQSSQQSSTGNMTSPFGDKVLICTASGFKWVSWDDLQNGNEQPKPSPQYQCALCYIAAHGVQAAIPTQEIALPYHQYVQHVSFYFSDIVSISQFAGRILQIRAPPYIA